MFMSDGIPGASAVSFHFGDAHHGWIAMQVTADGAAAKVSCSDVYDPFGDLSRLFTMAAAGTAGSCEVDGEGRTVAVRIDFEPGCLEGRLRLFRPGAYGEIGEMLLDRRVDILQVAAAWLKEVSAYAAAYDPQHWQPFHVGDGEEAPRTLAALDMDGLRYTLALYQLGG
jgi:hypothetical protein